MATQPGTGLPLDTDPAAADAPRAGGTPGADAPRAGGTPADDTSAADASIAAVADLPFDAALAQLAEVVGRLESGGLPLEASIALYERGVALHARCARLLDDAELRVQRLVEEAGGALRAIDLSPDDADDDPSASA